MKQLMRMSLWVLLLAVGTHGLYGQRTLSGKVTDAETGEAVAGVKILVVGAARGTFTDGEGNFSIEVPEGPQKLEFELFGYARSQVEVDATTQNLNVQLTPGTVLDEVVITGYGEVKREDATGSIQTVSAENFNKGAITAPQELIAGKIAGVQVSTGGDPGGGSVIRIRGGSSLTATNDPLIVIDGVPVDNGGIAGARNALNLVNPNDIETFTVLKDASATAIYGSRASNGVIMITTKRGAPGKKMSLGYNGNFSLSANSNQLDVLNAEEYRALINRRFPDGHPARSLLGSANTDWQAEIYRTAPAHDHNLSLSGALAGNIPYRVSLGYTDKQGVLKTDRFNRTTASVNLSPNFFDNSLQIKINLKGMLTHNQFADWGAIGSAVAFDPTQPVRDEGSPYGGLFTWTQNDGTPITIAPTNPLALLEMRDNQSDVQRFVGNVQADYRMPFLPELRANLNLGYDYAYGEGTDLAPPNAPFAFVDGGRFGRYHQTKRNELLEFYLNYVKELNGLKVDVMGGYSWQHFFQDNYNYVTNSDESKILTPESFDPKEYYLISLFGRVNLSLLDRLLVTFTLRGDGTSRFAPGNRWGLFPAAALAYKLVDNREGKLSNLKIRLGYGITGQQDIGGDFYPYLARYRASFINAQYQFGNEFVTTLRPEGYDANIKWEETTTYNAGIDFGFFNSRIYGSVDYYFRQTRDLLNFIPVPAGTNLTNFITTNVGDLENEGVEFALNLVPIKTQDLSWEIGGNVTFNRNEITRLTATEDPNYLGVFTGGIAGGVGNTIQIHSVGFPTNSFFVYEQVYDENGQPIEGLYVDRNGDGQVTPDDRYHLEKPAPDVFYGFTTRLTYKNLEFFLSGRANVGNYVYNNVWSDQAFYNRLY
ncbi:MAG: SusC/RagA family TonB-linked outer membrane protein, partial [Bacteroidetes bacterium]